MFQGWFLRLLKSVKILLNSLIFSAKVFARSFLSRSSFLASLDSSELCSFSSLTSSLSFATSFSEFSIEVSVSSMSLSSRLICFSAAPKLILS